MTTPNTTHTPEAIEACADEVLGWIVSYDGSPSTAIRALLTEEETP